MYVIEILKNINIYENVLEIFLFSVNIFTTYMTLHIPLYVNLLSQDGMYTSINFIKCNMDDSMTNSQVLKSNKIYNAETTERYIFYFSIYIFHLFMENCIFNRDLCYLRYIICICTNPMIFNDVIYEKLKTIFTELNTEKKKLYMKILLEQIANFIIYVDKIAINTKNKVKIDKNEIMKQLENVDALKEKWHLFLKKVGWTILLIYLRKNDSKIRYKAAKYMYMYGNKDYIKEMDIHEATIIYNNMIAENKYTDLMNSMTIQAIIYLFLDKDSDKMKQLVTKIKYRAVIVFTLSSVSSFFKGYNRTLSIIALSFVISYVRKVPLRKKIITQYVINRMSYIMNIDFNKYKLIDMIDDRSIISFLMTLTVGCFVENTLILSFVDQFSGILLFNFPMYCMMKVIYLGPIKKTSIILSQSHANKLTLFKYIILMILCNIYVVKHNDLNYFIPLMLFTLLSNSLLTKTISIMMCICLANNLDNIYKNIATGYILALVDNMSYYPHIDYEINSNVKSAYFNKEDVMKKTLVEIETTKKIIKKNVEKENVVKSVEGKRTKKTHKLKHKKLSASLNDISLTNPRKEYI
jgi:hypothetical protein